MGQLSETMYAGSAYAFRVEVSNERTGDLEDLGTWTEFWCTGKDTVADADAAAFFQLTMTGGDITVVDAVNGLIEITFPDDLFEDGLTQHLYLDVKGRDGDGRHWLLASGLLHVLANTTRARVPVPAGPAAAQVSARSVGVS